jgi:hypothetical protein
MEKQYYKRVGSKYPIIDFEEHELVGAWTRLDHNQQIFPKP